MQVNSVEQLQVWQTARQYVETVSALTRLSGFAQDHQLRGQMDACADSILANISEGFEQGTDRAFARYLFIARGSCAEARAHLEVALARGHVAEPDVSRLRDLGAQIVRMLTGLIDYLLRSDRKRR